MNSAPPQKNCRRTGAIVTTAATVLLSAGAAVALAQAALRGAHTPEPAAASRVDPSLVELRTTQREHLAAAPRWSDERNGRVTIPIADAMRLVVASGGQITFPSTAPAVAGAALGKSGSAGGTASGGLPPGVSPLAVAAGRKVYQTIGCAACHPIDGTNLINGVPAPGPSFRDLFGSSVPLESGQTVTADAAYISESIRFPQAKIHKGYTAVQMPNFGAAITDKDIQNLVAFLKANSKNTTPH